MSYRRKPVPRDWREEHHRLNVWSRYHSGGAIRGSRVYRAHGTCSCGETFNQEAGRNNMDREDVIEAWKDHVEEAWVAERDRATLATVVSDLSLAARLPTKNPDERTKR